MSIIHYVDQFSFFCGFNKPGTLGIRENCELFKSIMATRQPANQADTCIYLYFFRSFKTTADISSIYVFSDFINDEIQ